MQFWTRTNKRFIITMHSNEVGLNTDINIHLANGKSIKADVQTLVRKCTFFRHLFDSRFNNDSVNDIYITDYDSSTVKHLIRYILYDKLRITKKTNIAQLLALSDMMCLSSLHSMVCHVFEDVLCDRNCFQILEFVLQRNHQELSKHCWKYIFCKFPNMKHSRKSYDWNYKTLRMTLTNEYIRFIEFSTIIKYFKIWSIVKLRRKELLKKVISDILEQNAPTSRCLLELLEILSNLYENNRCIKLCKERQPLNLLVIGGHLGDAENFYSDEFVPHNEFHDNIQNGYSHRKSIPNMKNHRVFSASAVDRNGLYIAGGKNIFGDFLDSVEYYDFDMNAWTKELVMEQPKALCATVCVEDKLYVSGGCDVNNKLLKTVYIFVTKKNTWKRIADLNQARAGHNMCSVYGTIYAVGGKGEDKLTLNSVEYYDSFLNKWIMVNAMLHARWRFGMGVIQKYIFVFGGVDLEGNTVGSIERYDTSSDTWWRISEIQGIFDMGVATFHKTVYLCGGNSNNGAINLIQAFHSGSGVLKIIGQLKIKRSGTCVCILPDNEIVFHQFSSNCDTLLYTERRDSKLWEYPSIKKSLERFNEKPKIIQYDDFSLR